MSIEIEFDGRDVIDAVRRAPEEMAWAVERALSRAALEVAREERRLAPKAFSVLVNSIRPDRISAFDYTVGPHVEYAAYVERGRRPGGGQPPAERILDWVRVKRLQPRNPNWDQRDLAWAIAKSIQRQGIPEQKFVEPVLRSGVVRRRVLELMQKGVLDGLRRAGLEG